MVSILKPSIILQPLVILKPILVLKLFKSNTLIFSLEDNKRLTDENPTLAGDPGDPGEELTTTHTTIVDTFPWGYCNL